MINLINILKNALGLLIFCNVAYANEVVGKIPGLDNDIPEESAYADDTFNQSENFHSADEILATNTSDDGNPDPTPCASEILTNALANNLQKLDENAPQETISQWIHYSFESVDTITAVLECPEIISAQDDPDSTIIFSPVVYTFPGGREITVNYSVTPTILTQRLQLAQKRALADKLVNPYIDPNDPTVLWTNTDPGWYAIMIVRAGVLDEFVGPDKNNTLSLKYLEDNIDNMLPPRHCAHRTAIGVGKNNASLLHRAVKETVSVENDSNGYYVANNANLQWISGFEIAGEVALAVVTWGASAGFSVGLKLTQIIKDSKKMVKSIKTLARESKSVKNFIKNSHRLTKLGDDLKDIAKAEKNLKEIDNLRKSGKNAKQLAKLEKEQADIAKKLGKEFKSADDLKGLKNAKNTEIKSLDKAQDILKGDKDVKTYTDTMKDFSELQKLKRDLKAITRRPRGNILTKPFKYIKNFRKSAKAYRNGSKLLSKAARQASKAERLASRYSPGVQSSFVSCTKDFLFARTRINASRVARAVSDIVALDLAIGFIGDMYDYTPISTDDYTSGIQFKPLGLLSADDIEGQDNVVNYGMWLMWEGDSIDPNDDDAAYLQAMDFAEKLHSNMLNLQDEENVGNDCEMDIYVVRPIIREPGADDQALYYLIMNDIPWTTQK